MESASMRMVHLARYCLWAPSQGDNVLRMSHIRYPQGRAAAIQVAVRVLQGGPESRLVYVTLTQPVMMYSNTAVADHLRAIGDHLEEEGADGYRVAAYFDAARTLRGLEDAVEELYREG